MSTNDLDYQAVPGITIQDGRLINGEQRPALGILVTQPQESPKGTFSQFMGGLLLIGGSAGMLYGMVMLAMLIQNHFQNARKNDLMAGNPFCWDSGDASTMLSPISCASKECSKLQSITDASNWISNHHDLDGINANDVFNKCKAYFDICASSSGFTTPFNAGQDSAFDLNCDHSLTNLGAGFSWFGYALLSIMTLVATAAMLSKSYYCLSSFFKAPSEDSNSENEASSENSDTTGYSAV